MRRFVNVYKYWVSSIHQSNKTTKEGGDHPDRDAQFEHINNICKEFLSLGDPVISVDCKKKELVGEYKNNGQEWTPIGCPTEVNTYDFVDKINEEAAPYAVYDTLMLTICILRNFDDFFTLYLTQLQYLIKIFPVVRQARHFVLSAKFAALFHPVVKSAFRQ